MFKCVGDSFLTKALMVWESRHYVFNCVAPVKLWLFLVQCLWEVDDQPYVWG